MIEDIRSTREIIAGCVGRLLDLARIIELLEEDDSIVVDFRKEVLEVEKLQTKQLVRDVLKRAEEIDQSFTTST